MKGKIKHKMEMTLENYQEVYSMLEDEQSKDVFLNRLSYLISNNSSFIKKIVPHSLTDSEKRFIFWEEMLSEIPTNSKIILYGAGDYPVDYFSEWSKDKRIVGFCSNNRSKQETGYLGYPVISPEELSAQRDYYIIVSAVREKPKSEILAFLKEINYPVDRVYSMVEREAEQGQYFDTDFMEYSDAEVFVDAGCYHLENTVELKRRCNVKKVYAFEPDPDNYQICLERKKQLGLDEAEIFPFGTWSQNAMLHFNVRGTDGTHIAENGEGEISIPVTAIDEVVRPEDKVTFIKMDVEGAELESLKGCKKTIEKDKPKLAICIYHKPEDMVQIPIYIKELVPEYRLYIRHHSNCSWETVLYAMPKM